MQLETGVCVSICCSCFWPCNMHVVAITVLIVVVVVVVA